MLYILAYLVGVSKISAVPNSHDPMSPGEWPPEYFGTQATWADRFFAPIHQIDRVVRRRFWETQVPEGGLILRPVRKGDRSD